MSSGLISDSRSGCYVLQPTGYRAFIPAALPPHPPLRLEGSLLVLLSEADRAIGRLDAATQLLPSPDLFVAMYVRREAVYSSQIEGTQASLADLLEYEADAARQGLSADVTELVNYVAALNYGLERLDALPLSIRLIREIHEKLISGSRGGHLKPGELRQSQNWIGPRGCTLNEAVFVPPPPHEVPRLLGDLEKFLHEDLPFPPLVRCGLAHVQFETIHPFLDGNGRMGRLLITFWLCWKAILQRPLLYLSEYFKRHRQEYYDRLQQVREAGNWEDWMAFFLEGVRSVATEASETARRIQALRAEHQLLLEDATGGHLVLDRLCRQPMLTVNQIRDVIGMTYPVAADLVRRMEALGLLVEVTGRSRNRVFAYRPYLALLGEDLASRAPCG